MITIIEGGTPRKTLNEGRQIGFGSTLLKKIGEDKYQMLMGLTTCKDYLHDVLAAEHFNTPVGVYGLSYAKTSPFEEPYAFFGITMLDSREGKWKDFEKEKAMLKTNIKTLEKFLMSIETILNIKEHTKIFNTEDEDVWLVQAPKVWVSTTYLISLYTLLLRIGYRYEGQQNPLYYVKGLIAEKEFKNNDFGEDVNMLKAVWPKVEFMVKNGFPKENLEKRMKALGMSHGWHNNGIMAVEFQGANKSLWIE